MGTYVQLDCLDCQESLSFGKPTSQGGVLSIGLFSERDQNFRHDVSCWHALQMFLFRHENHSLKFRRDNAPDSQWIEHEIDIDALLEMRDSGGVERYYIHGERA